MQWINTVFWWTGAAVCGTGAAAGVICLVGTGVNYIWRRKIDIQAFAQVVIEAERQGVHLGRKK